MDANNLRALKKLALERGISLAELIRTLLQEQLRARSTSKSFKKEDFLAIVGLGESGERDISERHDRHIGKR